jgi:Periplasmic binding protein
MGSGVARVAWLGSFLKPGADITGAPPGDHRSQDLNAKGGVLGHSVELIVGDDACDADQAVALARKLVSDRVAFVAGHFCSHASIPASKVYEEAKILMIAPSSVNSKLTDEGARTCSASVAGTTSKGQKWRITLPSIGRARRSRFWMTVRSGGQASPTRSGGACMSAAWP